MSSATSRSTDQHAGLSPSATSDPLWPYLSLFAAEVLLGLCARYFGEPPYHTLGNVWDGIRVGVGFVPSVLTAGVPLVVLAMLLPLVMRRMKGWLPRIAAAVALLAACYVGSISLFRPLSMHLATASIFLPLPPTAAGFHEPPAWRSPIGWLHAGVVFWLPAAAVMTYGIEIQAAIRACLCRHRYRGPCCGSDYV